MIKRFTLILDWLDQEQRQGPNACSGQSWFSFLRPSLLACLLPKGGHLSSETYGLHLSSPHASSIGSDDACQLRKSRRRPPSMADAVGLALEAVILRLSLRNLADEQLYADKVR